MAREALSLTGIISLQSSVWQRENDFAPTERIQPSRNIHRCRNVEARLRSSVRFSATEYVYERECFFFEAWSGEAKISSPSAGRFLFPGLYLWTEWDPQGGNFSQKLGYFLRFRGMPPASGIGSTSLGVHMYVFLHTLAFREYLLTLSQNTGIGIIWRTRIFVLVAKNCRNI